MTRSGMSVLKDSGLDPVVADLLEALADRVQNGETIDPGQLARDYPEHAEQLLRLLPAVQMLATLDRSAEPGSFPPKVGELDTGTLGDFRIIREVGRGGMGVVYEAEQISLHRRVALKVLPFAATMDPRQLQRFRNEAQAAACLHHPNIVPVHGVGCERAVHFYAMQLIEGQSFAQVIAEIKQEEEVHHRGTEDTEKREKTSPRSSLCSLCLCGKKSSFFRHIAELVAHAADALEYAHSMGVVHRDIKPANLMLDEAGHLWVADFGLAKLNSDAGMTMTGDIIGTLRYMSPEQALAKHGLVDHRTDVYSLGATLYELLTLKPAVQGDDKQELLKHIAFEDPTPLRRIDKSIPAELETIALKALAKEPGERYATAGELAEDLRRWLGDKAIKARAPGVRERVGKWGRQHRAVMVTGIIALILFLIAGGIGVLLSNARLEVEKRFANKEKQDAEKARDEARELAAISQTVNDFLLVDLYDATFAMKNLGANENDARRLDHAQAKLEDALSLLKKKLPHDHPLAQQTQRALAATLTAARQFDGNVAIWERVLEVVRAQEKSDPRDLHRSIKKLAIAYQDSGRLGDALPLYDEALKISHSTLGADHDVTLHDVVQLASAYQRSGRDAEAVPLFERALPRIKAGYGRDEFDASTYVDCLNNLAAGYWKLRKLDRSIPKFEEAVKLNTENYGTDHLETLKTVANLGVNYRDAGRLDEALPLLEKVAAAGRQHASLRWARAELMDACIRADQFDRAADHAREHLAESRVTHAPGSPQLATALALNGLAQLRLKAWASAEAVLRECLAIREKTEPDSWTTFNTQSMLGGAILGQKKYTEAEPLLVKGGQGLLEYEDRIPLRSRTHLTEALTRIVQLYEGTGNKDKATEWRVKLDASRKPRP